MKRVLAAGIISVFLAGAAHAKDWQIDYAHSKLGFTGQQSGETFTGGFKTFTAQVAFDPDHPESGKIAVTVDIASAYAGNADRDAMLPQADWFNAAKFPQAQFTSTAIRKTGANAYEADGDLTIKGATRHVVLPFTLMPQGDHWQALGQVPLMRSDFAVGQGSFAGEDYVKHAVTVTVDLAAKP